MFSELTRRRGTADMQVPIAREHVELAREIIERGYRAAVRVHHPDARGSHESMQRLNATVEVLRRQLSG